MNLTSKNIIFYYFRILVYTTLFFCLYFSAFKVLVSQWERDDFSYCYLIPFIVFYLLWEKKENFRKQMVSPSWIGILPLLLSILFYWFGELGGEYYVIFISSWLLLIAICLLNFGIKKTITILFPLCFILTMFPLPALINNRITLYLKILSTKIGVVMIQIYGMSAYREGNVIDLGFTQLQVVDACSGLRYLYPMIVLSLLVSYFYQAQLWKKIILIVSSVPLTIFSNSLRIALTGILSEKFGSAAVEGFFHDFEGWLIFMFTLFSLLLEMWILKKVLRLPEQEAHVSLSDQEGEKELKSKAVGQHFSPPRFLVSVLMVGLTAILTHGIDFREKIPLAKSFETFPALVGQWKGENYKMEKKFIDALNFSDYVMIDYKDKFGKAINFYVAYYESQRKGESIHSPASCLRGGGWEFNKAGKAQIKLNDGRFMSVNRAVIEKAPVQQLSYYWFPARDRILTNAIEMKIYNFWDSLTRQRTDGALVRLITRIYPDEELADAEKRMLKFTTDIVPVLNEFLPGE